MTNQDPQPCHCCEARPHDTICDVCGEVVCYECLADTSDDSTVCIECQEPMQIESLTKEGT